MSRVRRRETLELISYYTDINVKVGLKSLHDINIPYYRGIPPVCTLKRHSVVKGGLPGGLTYLDDPQLSYLTSLCLSLLPGYWKSGLGPLEKKSGESSLHLKKKHPAFSQKLAEYLIQRSILTPDLDVLLADFYIQIHKRYFEK